jgi:hypothetical protein
MPQYLMSVWFDDDYDSEFDRTNPDVVRTEAQVDALNEEMSEQGIWVFVAGLHPADTATVVRSTEGGTSMTDGPYAESKEQMGGFWVIEAADLDAALDWAAKGAAACEGPVELRPFQNG